MKLIIRDSKDWLGGVEVAKAFLRDSPEGAVGVRAGVIYFLRAGYYVYRTKTAIVVRCIDR
jgi:hypothetical protein